MGSECLPTKATISLGCAATNCGCASKGVTGGRKRQDEDGEEVNLWRHQLEQLDKERVALQED